jgi:glutamate-1-semialdehyde 2,1-aminomutase
LNELEVEVAEGIHDHVPSAEQVRFCVTGSDGILFAIRLARSYTKRNKIIKFIGGYHGNNDNVLVDVSPSLLETGRAPHLESSGLDPSVSSNTITVPFNDPKAVERAFAQNKGEIAALLTEPIMHSSVGCILPEEGFLRFLREVTERNGSLLVFDEVITGFRHAIGGVQSIYGVTPDLSVVAKALANGFPIAAICGSKEVMSEFQPLGNVVEFGTYIAHPVSLAAAKATLSILKTGVPYEKMTAAAAVARKGITDALEEHKIDGHVAGFRSIIAVYFTRHEIKTYSDLSHNDMEMATRFKEGLLQRGILTLPLPLKRMHLSSVHSEADVRKLVDSSRDVIVSLKPGNLVRDRARHK